MISRNQEQEKIMFSIYQYLFYERMNSEDLKEIMENVFELPYDEIPLFSKEVCVKTLVHQNDFDEVISVNLNKWTLDRINLVSHAILLMSMGEIRFTDEISKAEIINIAVNLSKKYSDANDYKFINAILEKIL
ncbi:MAG: transcription antitermination protein NusB [Bacilli bacterium]|nr:transcription antitermination protein NusB [Bacillales bacterium]MDY2574505.1 transcription antitermination protein NusB [Bacilli bacterium]